jgi:hypothetical protein
LEKILQDPATQHGFPSLSLSLGLTLSARDLAIELGQLSIVAQHQAMQHHHHEELSHKEDQLCYKKVKRYILPAGLKDMKLLGEIVLYATHDDHLVAFA